MLGFSLRGTDKLEAPLPPGFSCTVLLFSKSFFLILCHILLPPWFYSNHHAISLPRLIIHKFREGSIDGLTLVFSHPLGKWSPISEISELKEIINILAEDEEGSVSFCTQASYSVLLEAGNSEVTRIELRISHQLRAELHANVRRRQRW